MSPITVPENILTDTHYQQIKNALDVIGAVQKHIDTARRAGINVDQHEAQLRETQQRLLALKNTYFPGR